MTITHVLTQDEIDQISTLFSDGQSKRKLARDFGVSRSVIDRAVEGFLVSSNTITDEDLALDTATQMSKSNQRLKDKTRVLNKIVRESNRIDNMMYELNKDLINVVSKHKLHSTPIKHKNVKGKPVGVIHLSDIHFGEVIELDNNKYNFGVASKRIQKLAEKAITHFCALGIKTVAVCLTGDIINSDRRLDEVLENSHNRSKAIFLAVDILQQFILHINKHFNVTVFSITGNESRVGKDVGWINFIASDNYDFVVHNMLRYIFAGNKGVDIVEINDPLEQVVSINDANILLIHGHNGLAVTSRIENEVSKVKARYATKGIQLDYVICGHIHSAYLSDNFARSSGLPGSNSYSEKALNLDGRASQNLYVVNPNRSGIDGIKVDLQHTDGVSGYKFDTKLESYHNVLTNQRSTVVIQSVLV